MRTVSLVLATLAPLRGTHCQSLQDPVFFLGGLHTPEAAEKRGYEEGTGGKKGRSQRWKLYKNHLVNNVKRAGYPFGKKSQKPRTIADKKMNSSYMVAFPFFKHEKY